MLRDRTGAHNQTGALGELVARQWLINKDFLIRAENYAQPWGEIDIIAERHTVIHFIEVKTVSYRTRRLLERVQTVDSWRPEEQVTEQKLLKLGRTIETWLLEHEWTGEWQIDVFAVRLVPDEKYASINWLWNVVPEQR